MKQKSGRKALSFLLALAMIIGLMPGMGMTAKAATLDSSSKKWSEDSTISENVTINGGVTVTDSITLTIPENTTLTVNGGINAEGHTLTVSGAGHLNVTGANGANGNNGGNGVISDIPPENGSRGNDGGDGFTGDVIVKGAIVTLTGGNGGKGGKGGDNARGSNVGNGGDGGNGGVGVRGSITVKVGSATLTGGSAGAGGEHGSGSSYLSPHSSSQGSSGKAGTHGLAVSGTTIGDSVEESGDGSTWTPVSGNTSGKQYVRAYGHAFTYSVNGATITALCTNGVCSLTEKKATLTISALDATYDGNSHGATLDSDAWTAAGLTVPAIEYKGRGDTSYNKSTTAPTDVGDYTASVTFDTLTAQTDFTISPMALTITGATAEDRTYDKDNTAVRISAVAFADSSNQAVSLTLGEDGDYTVTGAMSDADAGDGKQVNVAVTLKNANYSLATTTTTTTVDIGKAAAQAIEDVTRTQVYTVAGVSQSVADKMPNDAGTLTYTAGTPAMTGNVTVSSFDVDESGTVTATLSGGAAGDTVTLPVTIGSTNYTDSEVDVIVKLTAKNDAGASISEARIYGDADFTLTGSATDEGTGTGVWTWTCSDDTVLQITPNGATATVKILKAGSATVTARYESDTTIDTKITKIAVNPKTLTIKAKDQSIYVGGKVPSLSNPAMDTHYTVTGLVGEDKLTAAPTLAYQKNGSAATPDNTTAGTYDIVPSGASAGDNYTIKYYTNGTLTISDKWMQTITAADVNVIYGDTKKSVSATTDGDGAITYAVKDGSGGYIDVNASTGALTIKKVPADGKAYVTVTAAETMKYNAATKDVTVTISPADRNALNAAIVRAGEYCGGIAEYPEIAAKLQVAIDAAKAVAANDNASESEIVDAVLTLNAAADTARAEAAAARNAAEEEAARKQAEEEAAKKKAADQAAAQAVIDRINALPGSAGVGDKDAVEAAWAAYDALTGDQKALIGSGILKKLSAAEQQVRAAEEEEERKKAEEEEAAKKQADDAEAAKKVADAIKALPETAGAGDKDAVEAARKAYDALTGDQKKLIGEDVLKKLTAAEEQVYAAMEAGRTIDISACEITVGDVTYTGKKIKKAPVVTVTHEGTELTQDTDFTVTYDKKAKKIGTYKLTVTGVGRCVGSAKLTFNIVPKGTKFTKRTGGKKQITLKWKQRMNISGYQIEYSTNKDFSTSKKVKVKAVAITGRTIRKLKSGTTYYVRIRTYKTIKKKGTFYSAWSKVKTVTTKGKAANGAALQSLEMTVGGALDLMALLGLEDSESALSWASGDESVVAVSQDGIAQALNPGQTVVTATDEEGEEYRIAIKVNPEEEALLDLENNGVELPEIDVEMAEELTIDQPDEDMDGDMEIELTE